MVAALNKTSLRRQRDQLALYERFLPSLDLKRQQLIADLQRAREVQAGVEREIEERMASQSGLFSLLGASEQDLSGLVRLVSVTVVEENVLGIRVPVLKDVQFRVTEYSMLAKPFWVDLLVELLQQLGRLRIHRNVECERVRRLGDAVRRITQRVNLFEQVLIPRAQETIRHIRVYLADAERAAVIRSKIAKARQRRDVPRTEDIWWPSSHCRKLRSMAWRIRRTWFCMVCRTWGVSISSISADRRPRPDPARTFRSRRIRR